MMTPTAIEIGGLALIVTVLAFAQRLGGWEHKPLARGLSIAAGGLFVAWCFLFSPMWFGWMVAAIIWSICLWFISTWVRTPVDHTRERPPKQEESHPISHMDSARLSETKQQLLCLSHFEYFALWQLLLKGGLTGQQFAEIVQAFGIPVATLFGQKELAKTFAIIQDKSAMLICDETSGGWAKKPEFKDFVHYWIERMSPVFGI